jgi:hypothetical protein
MIKLVYHNPDSQSNKGNYIGESCFDPTLVWFDGVLLDFTKVPYIPNILVRQLY